MIKSLRKRHRQVWLVLGVLLPAGIILSWLVIPNQAPVKLLTAHEEELLPVIKGSKDMNDYQVTVRSNTENTRWQLEWINKKILAVPSAVIYKVNDTTDDITKNELIGRIEARGSYIFPLNKGNEERRPLKFVLYDFIHQQIIDSINLQP